MTAAWHKDGSGPKETRGSAEVAERSVLRHGTNHNTKEGRPLLTVAAGCAGFAVRSSLHCIQGALRAPCHPYADTQVMISTIFAALGRGSVRITERAAYSLTRQSSIAAIEGMPQIKTTK